MSSGKTAVIAGAGPAGLTAALELLACTDVQPIVFEADSMVGGLAKTVVHNGNRMDIGGHRFFSKSTRVMDWWLGILPLERGGSGDDGWLGELSRVGADDADRVMLVRERVSRILYGRRFYDYPVSLNANTIRNLGLWRMSRIGASYLRARLFPIRDERTLEQFMINRFGRELYTTFFEQYTEKVWGVPCSQIKADWGAQRIKGLSVSKALAHALRHALPRRRRTADIAQRTTETSLIERFLYPKLGPGQLWEEVARIVEERGGEVRLHCRVVGLDVRDERVVAAHIADADGAVRTVPCDYFISTMPVRELAAQLGDTLPAEGREIAAGLEYRDFITVGVLLGAHTRGGLESMPDNWIYVQEPDVKVGRLQIFNNWSPYLVADPDTVWIGMEYFAAEGDALWSRSDEAMSALAVGELEKLDLISPSDVLDTTVLRVPKAYPAYFGSYDRFEVLRAQLDRYANLYLIGRNGMHRYNNQDHSMLTAMVAVENIAAGLDAKDNIWSVNVEQEYHETKSVEASSEEEASAISA